MLVAMWTGVSMVLKSGYSPCHERFCVPVSSNNHNHRHILALYHGSAFELSPFWGCTPGCNLASFSSPVEAEAVHSLDKSLKCCSVVVMMILSLLPCINVIGFLCFQIFSTYSILISLTLFLSLCALLEVINAEYAKCTPWTTG